MSCVHCDSRYRPYRPKPLTELWLALHDQGVPVATLASMWVGELTPMHMDSARTKRGIPSIYD